MRGSEPTLAKAKARAMGRKRRGTVSIYKGKIVPAKSRDGNPSGVKAVNTSEKPAERYHLVKGEYITESEYQKLVAKMKAERARARKKKRNEAKPASLDKPARKKKKKGTGAGRPSRRSTGATTLDSYGATARKPNAPKLLYIRAKKKGESKWHYFNSRGITDNPALGISDHSSKRQALEWLMADLAKTNPGYVFKIQ